MGVCMFYLCVCVQYVHCTDIDVCMRVLVGVFWQGKKGIISVCTGKDTVSCLHVHLNINCVQ